MSDYLRNLLGLPALLGTLKQEGSGWRGWDNKVDLERLRATLLARWVIGLAFAEEPLMSR